jgi:hypothetical protein
MKSIKQEKCKEKKEKPFPKLMVGHRSGNIYLARNNYTATCVFLGKHNPGWGLGEVSKTLRNLTDYDGIGICLSNEEP